MQNSYSFFLGANSPCGFYSCYSDLINPETAVEVLIIKGPPGGGKSGFMRRVAEKLGSLGAETEFIHCSSDPESLDGVIFPEINTALVDGTAPHVVEPTYHSAVENYLNLGRYVNTEKIAEIRDEIRRAAKEYRMPYTSAYANLKAAAFAENSAQQLLYSAEAAESALKRAAGIAKREFKPSKGTAGSEKKRFLSGYTPYGRYVHTKTPAAMCDRIYEIEDDSGLAHGMLTYLKEAALDAGCDVIVCPDPLSPEKIEHLIVPNKRIGFFKGKFGEPYRRIRLSAYTNPDQRSEVKGNVKLLRKLAEEFIDDACSRFAEAKRLHDVLEKLYNPFIDFDALYMHADKVADRIAQRYINQKL